jgi:hypothetical protein
MFRMLAITAAIAAIAGSAAAQDVRVTVGGRDDATVRQDIRAAARKMCASYTQGVRGLAPTATCLKYAVRDAEAQLVEVRMAQAEKVRLAAK